MTPYLIEKLGDVIKTAQIHQQRLEAAYHEIIGWGSLNKDIYYTLTIEQIAFTDQYVYRFTKLQDLMGDKLFKLILQYVGEDTEKLALIDVLNKLEKLEIIESVTIWLNLRLDRNNIAHDYVKNIDEILEDLWSLIKKMIF
ncbi:MAG: hypothetical protein EAZ15_07980 [Sphingobacteriales bacterium]|nr:MAG: hypothetical protein EAZ15_07980 [Sphingobacteriales bacterium]